MSEWRHHYTTCGLDNVYLRSGFNRVEGSRGSIVRIENEQALLRAIGECLVRQKGSLSGNEMRFLRHQLGLSQTKLADLLGENEQSVARREKGDRKLKRPCAQERLLRFLYEEELGGNETLSEFLKALAELDEAENDQIEFDIEGSWHKAA